MEKVCARCGQSKPVSAFCNEKAKKDGKTSWCLKCYNERRHESLIQLKHEAYQQYGGEFCQNCGETLFEALTLDHLEGCPREERKVSGSIDFLRQLKKQNWPARFQVLCCNCNFLKFAHPDLLISYAERKKKRSG